MFVGDCLLGIRVVGKGSWKERKVGKFQLESLKFESFYFSWKEPSEIGKSEMKFERLKLESLNVLRKLSLKLSLPLISS